MDYALGEMDVFVRIDPMIIHLVLTVLYSSP